MKISISFVCERLSDFYCKNYCKNFCVKNQALKNKDYEEYNKLKENTFVDIKNEKVINKYVESKLMGEK